MSTLDQWYHGTPRWKSILDDGIDIDAPKHSDPGDFGWGIYLTKRLTRAQRYGKVFQLTVETDKLAHVPNPYFLSGLQALTPVTPEEKLFYSLAFDANDNMLTVSGTNQERIAASKKIRNSFLAAGYLGIISDYDGGEAVLFNTAPIRSLLLL